MGKALGAPHRTQTLHDALSKRILVLDGAMGTMIQSYGFAEEDFHRLLRVQTEPLKANLLIAAEGFDLVTAASSGEAFHGTAYVCP